MSNRTIVLIHGLWMTPLSWEHWIDRYEARGHEVLAPAWPGLDGDIDALRADPSVMEHLGIGEIVDHYEAIICELPVGPDHHGPLVRRRDHRDPAGPGPRCRRASGSTPPRCAASPSCRCRRCASAFPVLKSPANNHRAVALTAEQFHYAFTNTLSEEESAEVYERYAVPGPGRVLWQGALANFNPHTPDRVDFHNDDRAPLLLIAGGVDHVVPAAVDRQMAKQAVQVGGGHRVQGVPGTVALHHRPGGLGGSRRLRA